MATVGMLYSEQTQRFYGGSAHQDNARAHDWGMYHALIEAKVPFEMVHDLYLDEKDIDKLAEVFQKLDEIKFTGKLIDPSEFTNVYGTIEDFLLRRKQQFDSSRYSTKEEK